MALVTPTTQKITALGPIKMEVIQLPSSTDTADTFTTFIQNPLFAVVSLDAATHTAPISASFSGKTGTVTSSSAFTDKGLSILVFGF
jgi:hypothetical protein